MNANTHKQIIFIIGIKLSSEYQPEKPALFNTLETKYIGMKQINRITKMTNNSGSPRPNIMHLR